VASIKLSASMAWYLNGQCGNIMCIMANVKAANNQQWLNQPTIMKENGSM
jgi:hypothetical protein